MRALLEHARLATAMARSPAAGTDGVAATKLGQVFDATARRDDALAARLLNVLLRENPVRLTVRAGLSGLILDVRDHPDSCAPAKTAAAVLGLAVAFCELGPDRLGRCHAPNCATPFLDQSTNHSRRYCSNRCATRANVAAYRARRRNTQAGASGT